MPRTFIAVIAIALGVPGSWQFHGSAQSRQAQPLLWGSVKSAAGDGLEGVTVSARLEGRPVTVSVYTDAQGGYYFPSIAQGTYRVRVQAPGYQKSEATVRISESSKRQDFTIARADDFFLQLTGYQQFAALPEATPAQRRMKDAFLRNCTGCHATNIALQNRFDERGWEAIIDAMGRLAAGGEFDAARPANPTLAYFKKDLAAYLTQVRGPGSSSAGMKMPERPTGDATTPVVYEYDVPVESAEGYLPNNGADWSLGPMSGAGGGIGLHDAQPDKEGNLWLTDNTEGSKTQTVARVDGRTGEVTRYRHPGLQGRAAHTHAITLARDGTVWFTLSVGRAFAAGGVEEEADGTPSGRLARLGARSGTIEAFPVPKTMAEASISLDEDREGYIWASTPKGAVRFDPGTKRYREFRSITQPGPSYGMAADRSGNGWWTQIGIDIIGYSDIKTGAARELRLPPTTNRLVREGDLSAEDLKMYGPLGVGRQQPRRPAGDPTSDYVWVPNYASQTLLRIDTRTAEMKFYPSPRYGVNLYMAGVDGGGNVWINLQNSDEVAKFDPKTEQWTFYVWPSRGTGARGLRLMDANGTRQVGVAYWNASRVARMVIRTRDEVEALRRQVQSR